ncbi:MAG TPA: lytic transglycosylase domain-containing protein [bacterium]|nr:lytic transglycosylase domain-containing protein [bacterium]
MDCAAIARQRRLRLIVVLAVWAACLLAGVGTGISLAAPDADEAGSAPDARAAALAEAFGSPCGDTLPAPPVKLIAPLDGLYTQFVQARCQAAAGQLAKAAQGFQAGLDVPMAVPAFWRWELLQTHVLAGDDDGALKALEALLETSPDPVLIDRVRDLITTLTLDPGTAPPARQMDYLTTYLENITPDSDDYDLLLRLWELAGDSSAPDRLALRKSLTLLLWRNPKDAEAAKRWAALPGTPGPANAAVPSAADYYARAERLFSLGLFDELAAELENPALPELATSYAKSLGRLYFRALIRGNALHHAAVQVNTGSVMRRFSFDRRQQLIWAIRVQLKRRKIGPVLKYLEELEKLSPKDPSLPTIFLELLKYNEGQHDVVTVAFWLKRLETEFPATQETSDAYWELIWNAIERRAYGEAVPMLDRAIAHSKPFDPVDQARLHYWRGRVQMLQGHEKAGQATWKDMEQRWPYGYYTAMAQWKQAGAKFALGDGSDGSNGQAPQPVQAPHIEALWKLPPFPQALFLFSVGEDDLGTAMLRDVVAQPMPDDALQEAQALFYYLNRHYLQLRLLANHELNQMRNSTPGDTPLWHRAFPRPHWEVVRRLAEQERIDPYFIFAIMREESRFFTSAYSHAGAKGLMQLMPSTARQIAKRNGLDYDEGQLHTPKLNIPIGTIYLKRVLKRFDENLLYAAAAYNAGPTNVKRWVRRYGGLPLDEFVERIPFGETQRYVKRVFLSYIVYTKLYR